MLGSRPRIASLVGRQILILACLFLLASAGTGLAAGDSPPLDAKGLPVWQKAVWQDFPVRMELDDSAQLTRLLAEVPIASFDRSQMGFETSADGRRHLIFEPRLTEAEAAALTRAGYTFVRVPDLLRAGRLEAEAAWASGADKTVDFSPAEGLDYYPTCEQVGQILAQLATDHPSLCRTFTWGNSVLGRDQYGLVVSADVHNTAPEPEVRLSSSMHGDEPIDMVMLLNLAAYLAENYSQTGFEDVTYLVDNYEVHIMPLHNPDGYVAGSRYNDNGVDLNRNFPEPAGTHPTQQIENLNFMAHASDNHFVISQNGHSGALVVNYPWDYTYDLTADNDAIIQLALEYSTYNQPMYDGFFDQGITNGAEWYVVRGSLQDWSLYITGCIDLTVEISVTKWPTTSQLGRYWDDNRESLIHFVKAARYGINGVVTGAQVGEPVAATITVAGNDQPVYTDPEHGDYYKLLPTGTYTLSIAAEGYETSLVSDVSTVWGTPTVLDIELQPLPTSVPEGVVRAARIMAQPNPFNPTTTIRLVNPRAGQVSVGVFDVQGKMVRTLQSGHLAAGEHDLIWDGRDDRGAEVASGMYFARMAALENRATVKLMLVR